MKKLMMGVVMLVLSVAAQAQGDAISKFFIFILIKIVTKF